VFWSYLFGSALLVRRLRLRKRLPISFAGIGVLVLSDKGLLLRYHLWNLCKEEAVVQWSLGYSNMKGLGARE
jgi:hypothetical protein